MTRIALSGLLAFGTLLTAPAAHGQRPDPATLAMAERRPEDAIRHLHAEIAKGSQRPEADRLHYLLARAQLQAARYAEAIATADALRERWPASPYARKVHFLKADAFVAQKDFQRADEIYVAETSHLVSTKRKEEVATVYLQIAERAYKPKARDEKPDYLRAERFFRLALSVGLSPEKTREVRYRIARSLYKRRAGWQAIRELQSFLGEIKKGPFVAEARFTLGRAYQQVGNQTEARKAFRDFLDDHTDHLRTPEAAYRVAETFGLPNPSSDGDLERGVRAARDYVARFGTHKWAPMAELNVAEAFQNRGRHDDAIAAYRQLVEKYQAAPALTVEGRAQPAPADVVPTRELVARAKVRLGDALRAQRKYPDAIAVWRAYLRDHPADKDWDRAQRAILDAEFEIAVDHYLAKRYGSAREVWENFLARYPLDGRNPRIMRLLGQIEYDQGRFAEAVKAWRALVSKYGSHAEASRAHYQLALTLADKLGDFDEAMKELEKVQGSHSYTARTHLQKMKEEALRVVTERIFRGDEKPQIKIVQRNLPRLSLRLYKIDMETYFRRLHKLTDVDALDLALIAPDKAWDEPVSGFVKWKESEHTLTLPVHEPGVYAVTVAGGKLESTTVVHVTDLALITKASRSDLLVLALDTRNRRAWGEVKVIVSDGRKVLFEAATGPDGVLHKRDALFKDLSGYTVFATAGGHVAGTHTGHVGGAARVVAPRGLVYTDRPAYKPGDTVNVRAIVRRVERGGYVFRAGEPHVLTVLGPRGETLVRRDVVLDEFGTLSSPVSLDANAPTGHYRVLVAEKPPGGARFEGRFQVQIYKLEKVRLDVAFDRPVFMRGEKVTGKVKAQYQFGEPVVGKKITYSLVNEGRTHEAVLSRGGEAAFSFESRNYDWDQTLVVQAQLPDEGVAGRGQVRLATEEFVAKASVERPVYLAGEEALVTLEARDVLDKPKVARFQVDVFFVPPPSRVTLKPGGDALTRATLAELGRTDSGEVRVGRMEVATAADTGRGLARFRVTKSGTFVFRARATDRFGNPIVASASTTASGEDDAVRVRIFSGQEQFRVGEQASLQIHSRVARSDLALVTFEADGIAGYRLVPLRSGENPLSFLVTHEHAPNVRVAVALVDGPDLLQAAADFRVVRGLTVRILPAKKTAAPGEKVKVKLRATDQNGKPVRASLSLAVVDEALFALFPDLVPEIQELFYGQRREIVLATAASTGYRHEARTKAVSDELLAEESRRESEKKRAEMVRERAPRKIGKRSIFRADMPAPSAAPAPVDDSKAEAEASGAGVGRAYGDARSRLALGRTLAKNGKESGGAPRVRARFAELAHWSPAVVTGADGEAEVEVALPDNTTQWRLTTRGASAETLVGQARDEITSKRDFFVEARFPRALTEGDLVKPLVRVHNFTGKAVRALVRTVVRLGETAVARKAEVDTPERGAGESGLESLEAGRFQWGAKNDAVVETTAAGPGLTDSERITVPLLPWGSELRAAASGTATAPVTRYLSLAAGESQRRALRIHLGPPPNRLLVEMALSRQGLWPASPASIAQWLLVTRDVLAYLRAHGRGGLESQKLEAQLAGLAQSLTMAQNSDGGVAWAGRGTSNPFVSAQALRALVLAREAGATYPDASLQQLAAYVGARFREQQESDHAEKAALLYGLAHLSGAARAASGVDPFASANRLYRLRSRLTPLALAHLTLALDRLGRRAEVAELSGLLATRVAGAFERLASASYGPTYFKRPPWFRDRVSAVATIVDAIQRGAPTHALVKSGAEWLLRRRYGFCWYSPRLTQAAVQALSRYFATTRFAQDRYRVTVKVNDRHVTDVDVRADGGLRRVEVPPGLLVEGKNKVELELAGRGEVSYAMALTAFTRGIDRTHEDRHFEIVREYEPAPRRLDGRALPRGFSILTGKFKSWKNRLTQLPVGERAQVTLRFTRKQSGTDAGFLIIEEPLPAGTSVDPDSLRGSFLHHEILPDKILFLVERAYWQTQISYDLFGVIPGKYRVLPSRLVSAYDPGFLSTGKEAEIEVLEKGESPKDPYRPTPDEDLAHGKALFDQQKLHEAAKPLERLLAGHGEQYTLRDDAYRDLVRMLLYVALDAKKSDQVVRYFEILKEKFPELVVPLDKSVEIGRAYLEMRELERAHQVLRATTEASFNVESQVGGALDKNGEPIASVRFVRGLLAQYPDLPSVQTAQYGLAQHLVELDKRTKTDPILRALKLEKGLLLDDAIRVFWEFMALYPGNPTVDEAGFSLASTYLAREEQKGVIELTERLRKLHPKSSFLDAYEYIQALAAFALERYDDALGLCQKVSSGKYFNDKKELVESSNRDLAILIMGQILHALGKAEKALERYKRVEEKFPDAREAVQSFERVALSLPEVTTVSPGERAEVKVQFRNVTDVNITLYGVDLMKLYLIHRDLNNITRVNLAGIKPLVEKKVSLASAPTYRDVESTVALPVRKKGAYLVVLKGKDVEASGMLLVSDLKLEVKEDPAAGRVRVHVLDRKTSNPVRKVFVRVVGSADGRFQGDHTDLRGVLAVDGVSGRPTVIAAKGASYAFHRSTAEARPGEPAPPPPSPVAPAPKGGPGRDLQLQIEDRNLRIQQKAKQRYQEMLENQQRGVEVDKMR